MFVLCALSSIDARHIVAAVLQAGGSPERVVPTRMDRAKESEGCTVGSTGGEHSEGKAESLVQQQCSAAQCGRFFIDRFAQVSFFSFFILGMLLHIYPHTEVHIQTHVTAYHTSCGSVAIQGKEPGRTLSMRSPLGRCLSPPCKFCVFFPR